MPPTPPPPRPPAPGPGPESGSRSGRERRRHPRAAGDWPLSIRLTAGSHAGLHTARVRDISRAGVCFYMEHPIPLMTVLEVALELPVAGGVRRVHGEGAVVRCEPISASLAHYEVAVFIQHMADADRDAIAAHVAKRAS